MHRRLTLLLVAALLSAAATGGGRILVQPPRLALLATHLAQLGVEASREFADITLDVLLETYRQELAAAARERAGSAQQRAKLDRWQRATADLATQLQRARRRLQDGAPFSVYADPQHQVLILVDGQPVAVSGPRLDAERLIEERVIERFCAFNDCSPLTADDAVAGQPAMPGLGVWTFGEAAGPAFEIEGVMRCEFPDLNRRAHKARLCQQAAQEALQLAGGIAQARQQGYRIDWDWLAGAPRSRAIAGQVAVNRDGAYLAVPGGLLGRLAGEDWQRLVAWLRRYDAERPQTLVLRHTGLLLPPDAVD